MYPIMIVKGVDMQTLFIFFSLICFWTNTLFANEVPKKPIKVEILINEIKNAKPEDRRALMNQLKLKLRAMNQGSRAKAMMRLRKSFAKHSGQGLGQNRHGNIMHQQKSQQTPHISTHKGMQQGQQKGHK